MRIFNSRYFFFAAALLAVWLLGRSRSAQPDPDPSWTNVGVGVGDFENVVSNEQNAEPVLGCQQETECTNDVLAAHGASVEQILPQVETDLGDVFTFEQVAPVADVSASSEFDNKLQDASSVELNGYPQGGDSDTVSETYAEGEFYAASDSFAEPSSDADSDLAASESFTIAEPFADSNSFAGSNSFSPAEPKMVSKAVEQTAELAQVNPSEGFASVQPSNGNMLPAEGNRKLIGNKYATEAPAEQEEKSSSRPWRKNPFADAPVIAPTSKSEPNQLTPASFDRDTESILAEPQQTLQATFPEQAFSMGQSPVDSHASNEVDIQTNGHAGIQSDITPLTTTLSESAAQEAVHHIEYGKSLSRRGATFGARKEFFAALGVIARGNDLQTGGNAHTTALSRAMRAMVEAQDFMIKNADTQVSVIVPEVLETHQTHIINSRDAANMTPIEAMQRYFTFAHQQLDFAGGSNVVVAEALFCLGKLHTVMAKHQPEKLDIAKAIVFHRASLSSDPQNYRSFNELGVLLARSGQLDEAENLFKKSLQIRPAAETWQNLAKTHRRRGESELAQLAQTEFSIAAQIDAAESNSSQITWLPQQAFSEVASADFYESATAPAATSKDAGPASRTAALAGKTEKDKAEKKTFAERFNLKKWF